MSATRTERRRRVKAKNVRVGDLVETNYELLRVTRAKLRNGRTHLAERREGRARVRGGSFDPDTFLTLLER